MVRHLILVVLFSIIAVVWMTHISAVITWLNTLYVYITELVSIDVAGYTLGKTTREVIALFGVPVVFGLAIQLVFWLLRKPSGKVALACMWGVWLMLFTMLMTRVAG